MTRQITIVVIAGIALIAAGIGVGFGAKTWLNKSVGAVNVPRGGAATTTDDVARRLTVRVGFAVDVFADGVPGARDLITDSRGRLLVSQTGEGSVTALEDADGDGKAESSYVILDGLDGPHGLAFDCRGMAANPGYPCQLYVAEHDTLSRYSYDAGEANAAPTVGPREELLELSAGAGDRHKTRSLLFLPSPDDDTLLISVGSSCDACEDAGMRGKVMAYDVRTGRVTEYATGLRNAVFMAIHPANGRVYATEMGRDGLGDNLPPDEVNVLTKGGFYGWPWLYGASVRDQSFQPTSNPLFVSEPRGSAYDVPAHSAPLGISFVPEEGWPEGMWFDTVIAYHGSWNRSVPTGYKVVTVKLGAPGEGTETDFVTGFLTETGEKLGRPVDVLALPGGVLYITDDQRGAVYRVYRTAGANAESVE